MIKFTQQRPTITAGAYSSGDAIGGLLTFNTASGTIISATLSDLAKQSSAIDLVLFSESFTATADNAAFDPWDGAMRNCLGVLSFAAANYAAFNDSSIATLHNIQKAIYSTEGLGKIYGQLISRGTPTYASTEDLAVSLWIAQ